MIGSPRWVLATLALIAVGCSTGSSTPDPAASLEDLLDSGAANRIVYAEHADGFADLWLPENEHDGSDGSDNQSDEASQAVPVVVLIHGGFWRTGYSLDLMDPLVPSLLAEGFAVWNIEYRRVGGGGGYPETFDDVAAAIDQLASLPAADAARIDLGRVAVAGHSAGGHLAVWSTARGLLPTGVPGAEPRVVPSLAVSQAGVLDLVGCAEQGVGGTACIDLVGGTPTEETLRYEQTSPIEMLPIDAQVVAVHGDLDTLVPLSQSERYVERATEDGVDARLEIVAGADHFSHLDPADPAWQAVLDALRDWRG